MGFGILPEDVARLLVIDFGLGALVVGVVGPDLLPQLAEKGKSYESCDDKKGYRGDPAG